MPTISDKTLLLTLLALIAVCVGFFTQINPDQAIGPDQLTASAWRTLDGQAASAPSAEAGLQPSGLVVQAITPGRFVGLQQSLPAPPAGERLRLSARLRVSGLHGRPANTFPARLLLIPRGAGERPLWRLPHVVAQFDTDTPPSTTMFMSTSQSVPWQDVGRTFIVADGVESLTVRAAIKWSAGRVELQQIHLQRVRLSPVYRIGRGVLVVAWIVLAVCLLVRVIGQHRWRAVHLPAAAAMLALLLGALAPNPPAPVSAALPTPPIALPVVPVEPVPAESPVWIALRKSAHLIGFAVLTALLLVSAQGRAKPLPMLAAIALFAVVTEVLQFFAPTRSPHWMDLLIDAAGIGLAALLVFAARWFMTRQGGGRRSR